MAPIVTIALALTSGAAVGSSLSWIAWPTWLGLLAAAGLAAVVWPRPGFVVAAVFFLGGSLGTSRPSGRRRLRATFACRIDHTEQRGPGHWSASCSRTWVRRAGSWRPFAAGRVMLSGPLPTAARPGRLLVVRARARGHSLVVSRSDVRAILEGPRAPLPERLRHSLRRRLEALLSKVNRPGSAILWSLLLGAKTPEGTRARAAFAKLGLAHILVISGLHLGLLAAFVFWLVRLLAIHFRRLADAASPHVLAAWATLLLVWPYALTVAPSPATLRAAVMVTAMLSGLLLHRAWDPWRGLAAATMACLVVEPRWIQSVGFQLSVTATAALLWLARSPRLARTSWPLRLAAASAAATLATSGLAAHHFGAFSAAGVLTNLLAIPLFCWFVLPLGLVGLVLGLAWPALGILLLSTAAGLARFGVQVVEQAARLVWWARIPWRPGWLEVALFYGLLLCGPILHRLLAARTTRSWLPWTAAWLGAGLVALVGIHRTLSRPTLLVLGSHCGQAAVVLPGWGHAVVVDAGCGSDPVRIQRSLESHWVRCIDLLVVTHCHRDHAQGALWLLRHSCVRRLWVNAQGACPLQARISNLARHRGVVVESPHPMRVGSARLRVLSGWDHDRSRALLTPNEDSLVLRIQGPDWSVLLPGDAGPLQQAALVDRGLVQPVDVLVAPHHASELSLYEPFLRALRPHLLLVSGRTPRTNPRKWASRCGRVETTSEAGDLEVDLSRIRLQPAH